LYFGEHLFAMTPVISRAESVYLPPHIFAPWIGPTITWKDYVAPNYPDSLTLLEGTPGKAGAVFKDNLSGAILKWNGRDWENVSNRWQSAIADKLASASANRLNQLNSAQSEYRYMDSANVQSVVDKWRSQQPDLQFLLAHQSNTITTTATKSSRSSTSSPSSPTTWLDNYLAPIINKGRQLINAR